MPTLFLIDGSSQMYRAYHAIRGLTGPDGRSTNAVYGFVTMLRKLLADHQPDAIAASFDLRGPHVPRRARRRLQGQPRADAADLVEQIPLGPRGLRGPRRAGRSPAEGFEADDVIGTLARAGGGRGLRRRDRHRRQGLLPARRRRASASSTRATRAPGTTRPASSRSSACTPDQVVDVLALMGDAVDNVKGVPGIGEKGARELIAHVRLARRAARGRGRRARRSSTARRCWPTPTPRAASRELVTIRTDVPVDRRPRGVPLPRARPARRCYALFSELGFRIASRASSRRRPPPSPPTTRIVESLDEPRGRSWRSCAVGGPLRRCACSATMPPPCARASSASRSRAARGTRATCRSATARSTRWPASTPAARSRALAPLLEDAARREGRPRPEVRRHRARAPRRRRWRARRSTRCSPATCSTPRGRRTRSRTLRSSTSATRR